MQGSIHQPTVYGTNVLEFKLIQVHLFLKSVKMISKNRIKYIHSLELKKFRNEHRVFVAEGNKLVTDMLPFFPCELLLAKPSWMATQGDLPVDELLDADDDDIRKASFLKNPQDVLAIFKYPEWKLADADPTTQLVLALDGLQDPGNLGTIVRLADWFGIRHLVCSLDTADIFSPKAVQATMGALAHISVHYTDLELYLEQQSAHAVPVYGTFLDGTDMYTRPLSATGILVMGNEGNGIRPVIEALVNEKLYIPNYPVGRETAESLNVAIATAVVCAEFRRRQGSSVQEK